MSFEGRPPSHLLLSEEAGQPNQPARRPVFVDSKTMIVHAIPFVFVAAKGQQLLEDWSAYPWRTLQKILQFHTPRQQPNSSTLDPPALDGLMKTLIAGSVRSGRNLDGWLHSEEPLDNH